MRREKAKRFIVGPTMQKCLLLLGGGIALGLAHDPRIFFKIQAGIARDWQRINQRALRDSIKKLYEAKLVDYKENFDGTITVALTQKGQGRYLTYNLDTIKIKRPSKWDRFWRVVIFDVPEFKKKGRNALALKLKQMGFYRMQKSVYIIPFPCQNEIDFVIEIFELRPYVRSILAKETDIDLHLRSHFRLR